MIPTNDVLNAHEAARFLCVHVETIRRLARSNEIPAFKVGRSWRLRKEVLLQWADINNFRQHPGSILIVDDDKAMRELLRRILEFQAYTVHEAADGAKGLIILEQHPVDLVLLDLKMPVMNGPEFLRKLRSAHGTLPVVIITGYPDSDLIAQTFQYGPITMLAKPVEKEQLFEALRIIRPPQFDTMGESNRTFY